MSKPVKISTVLTRAAKYIEEHGLAKGEFFKYRNGRRIKWENLEDLLEVARAKSCPACARGALYIAEDPSVTASDREIRHMEATDYIEQGAGLLNEGFFSVPDWNDRDETTKEAVVQRLKDAAKAARKDGK